MIIQNNQPTRRTRVEERDIQLLKMIRKQPEEGMSLLIDEYGGAIKAICSNVLRNYDAGIVQDAMQETVIRLWQKLSQRFQVKKNLRAYIYQTARNCALDYLRKYQRHSETDFEGVEDMMQDVSTDVEREFSRKHNERIVHEVIKEMEEPDRTIFILRFFYYETVKVIAETVHLKEDNVESRIRRGKKKLKAELLRRGVLNE